MSRPRSIRVLVGALLFASLGFAQAQTADSKNPAKPPQQEQAKDQEKAKEPEKPKTIDELTKDFQKMEGLVTIYRQSKDKKDTVYLELPESKLDKLMLIQITSGSGMGDTSAFVFHGMPINDVPVQFRKLDDARVQLIAPNLYHRGTTVESKIGIKRSFPELVLATFDVAAKQEDRKTVLVDVSNFFKSDVADLSTAVDSPSGRGGFGIDPSGTRIDTVKNFPENFVIRTVYQLQRKGPAFSGDPKSVPWAVSFNVSEIPVNNGYRPRLGDPRVGYFTTYYEDLTDATQLRDPVVNYIQRWNLVKKDPSAAVSEPVEPIVFYIDNAVPQEYRESVRKGILMWNEVFEQQGFKNAIVVNQMPEDADWDIADLRYNVVRWTTGMPFAIALFRANPLTGQILNASINMDAVFAAGGASSFDFVVDPATSHLRALKDEGMPQFNSPALKKWAPMLCDLAQRGTMAHAVGFAAAETLTPNFGPADRERIVKEYITEVVAHEMGHCLGLRHNFAASTQLTMKDLRDQSMVSKYGIGASVMDYSPFNAAAIGVKDVNYYAQRPGTYDFWAIKYGYMPVEASTPEGEVSALKQVASLGSTPGHLYQSDGSADDFDPYVVRFDLSRQPLDYLETMSGLGPRLRAAAMSKVAPGESYYKFTRIFMAGVNAQVNNALAASQFIGAGRLMTSFKGDANEQPGYRPLDAATQRRALALMNKNLFSKDSFNISKSDMAKLTFNPKLPYNEADGRTRLFPIQSSLANAERLGLMAIFDADTLQRMRANEFRVGPKNTLSMAEMFDSVNKTVWSEVDNAQSVADLRRELQRAYLDVMIPMALGQQRGAPNDARDLAMDQLVSLKHRITVAMPKVKDSYSSAHLRQSLTRINRALNAQSVLPAG